MAEFDVGHLPRTVWTEFLRYAKQHNKNPKNPTAFEEFVLHLYLIELGIRTGEQADVLTGGRADTFLDAVLFLVNGKLIVTKADFIALGGQEIFDIQIHLVQVTSAKNPPVNKLDELANGCCNFFAVKSAMQENERTRKARALKDYITESMEAREGCFTPALTLTYIWPGEAGSKIIKSAKKFEESLKKKFPDFDICIKLVCQNDMEAMISASEISNEGELSAQHILQAPAIDGVEATFIGFASAQEIVGLTSNSAEGGCKPNYSIFYDNVRAFLGWTDTNKNISATAKDPFKYKEFIIRNNGIVFSARDFKIENQRLILKNYQVVNGCQTCCVLIFASDSIYPDCYVPIKIIVSRDADIVDKAIDAANRHNPIGEFDLLARHPYARRLEQYFKANFPIESRMYLERRAGQYKPGLGPNSIPATRLLDLKTLLLAVSVLQRPPHQVQNDGSKKLRQWVDSEQLFAPTDSCCVYHVVALVIGRLRELRENWATFGAKYHVYYATFSLIQKRHHSLDLRTRDYDTDKIRSVLRSEDGARLIKQALASVERAFQEFKSTSSNVKTLSDAAAQKGFTVCLDYLLSNSS